MEGVRHQDHVLDVAHLQKRGGRRQRLPRRVARHFAQDVVVGHALGVEVVGRGRGLGEVVPGLAAAGDDDHRGHVAVIEVDGVVQPRSQHGRGSAVVLGGAEHDDGLGLVGVVAAGGRPHLDERDCAVHEDGRQDASADFEADDGDPPHRYPASLATRARAVRNRSSTRSRPRTASDSNSGGPTERPVTATRTGAWALASLSPCRSPTSSVTSWSTPASQSHSPYSLMASSSTPAAAGAFIASCHDFSSMTGSSRNRKSTISGTSASVFTRSCTSAAIRSKTSASKFSGGHGGSVSNQGSDSRTNVGTGSDRMYSLLMWSSFWWSKNAAALVTSSSWNSATASSIGRISRPSRGAHPSRAR